MQSGRNFYFFEKRGADAEKPYIIYICGKRKIVPERRKREGRSEEVKRMAAEYTHQMIAEAVYEELPQPLRERLADPGSYDLGAQGADIFYFLHPFRRRNAGKVFHNEKVYETFEEFLRAADGADAPVLSYIAGYITHYAADVVFHPYVYSLTERLSQEQPSRRIRWHSYIESDLDTYYAEKYCGQKVNRYASRLRSDGKLRGEVAALLQRVCAACGIARVSEGSLRRAVNGYLLFERFFTDKNFRKRRAFERGERLLHLPQVLSVLCRREEPDGRVLNAGGERWSNLSDPEAVCADGADELFRRAVDESRRLILAFFRALDEGGTLPREDFGKGFLSGVDAQKPFVRPRKTGAECRR